MVKKSDTCPSQKTCPCKILMALVIIALVWISTETWSKVVITIAAALILLGSGSCMCRAKQK